jgi:hypothetical protein
MIRTTLFVFALAGFAGGTAAAPDYAGCYEREYDAAHLEKHKLQEITRMRLFLNQSGDDFEGSIAAAFRALPEYQSSPVRCAAKGDKLDCLILEDGGNFTVAVAKTGVLITNTSQMRFGPEETGISFQREAEHLKFLLRPAACP